MIHAFQMRYISVLFIVSFLTYLTPAAAADPYVIAPDLEFGRAVANLLKEDKHKQVAALIRNASYGDARDIDRLWEDLSTEAVADDQASAKAILRHRLLRLYLQHGYCQAPRPIEPIVSDYLALKDEFEDPNQPSILSVETARLLIETLDQSEQISDESFNTLFERALDILQKNPDDVTPFYLLRRICQQSKNDQIDVRRLSEACVAPEHKIKLAYFLMNSKANEFSHEIALDALRHLANDEEAAALIWRAFTRGSPNSSSPEIIIQQFPIFIKRYAETESVNTAFSTLLSSVFDLQGSDAALQTIDEYTPILDLNENGHAELKNSVITMMLNDVATDLGNPQTDEIFRNTERLIAPLINKPVDKQIRLDILTNAFRIYKQLGKAVEMEKVAKTFVDLGNAGELTSTDRYITTEVAHFFMASQQFEDAVGAWKMWRPPFMFCGAYHVDPSENQRMQIAACYLALKDCDAALNAIAESLFAERYCNGHHEVTPLLLFYLYDRAGQLDDLKNIASEIEALGVLHTDSRQPIFEAPNQPTSLPQRQNWGVRQLFKVRELAANRDYAALRIFFKNTDEAFKNRSDFYDNDPLDNAFQWEAIKGLAKEPTAAIEIADQALKVDSELIPDWFFLALLVSDDAKAKDWLVKHCRIAVLSESERYPNSHYLLRCLPHLGPEGAAIVNELESRAANNERHAILMLERHEWDFQAIKAFTPYKHSFPWPAPKNGSLPKSLMPYIKAAMNKEPS